MRSRFLAVFLLSLAVPSVGRPHPVSYKGAFSIMSWNQPEATDWMTTYTLGRTAAAARFLRLDTEAGELRAGFAQLNARLKRWNGDGYQGNVYVSAGAGAAERGDDRGPAGYASFQADHESRRHLLLIEGSHVGPDQGPGVWRWEARAGLAPYLAEFDEVSAWFILSLQGQPQMEHDLNLVPLVRVFYRNVLGEFGAGIRGDLMFNFMVHF